MKRVVSYFFISSLIVTLLSFGYLSNKNSLVSAQQDEWIYTSDCIASECGTTQGTKTQTRYEEVCEYSCPVIHFEWSDKSADIEYEKSNDPHKCHRHSDNTLRDFYEMDHNAILDFKKDNKEWIDSFSENCHQEVVETRTVNCDDALIFDYPVSPTPTCTTMRMDLVE